MIRVLIVDDQPMVRAGIRWLLEGEPDLAVVGEAVDGGDAVRQVRTLRPDVVLMDIRMPSVDGIAATRLILESVARARVLVLTTFDLDELVHGALAAGASGFLLKDAPAEELTAAIRVVHRGDALLAPAVTRRVIDTFVTHGPTGQPAHDPAMALLTGREREVYDQMVRGLSNQEIARALCVSEATAKTHVSSVLTKLHLRDRVHTVIHAYEHGLARPWPGSGAGPSQSIG